MLRHRSHRHEEVLLWITFGSLVWCFVLGGLLLGPDWDDLVAFLRYLDVFVAVSVVGVIVYVVYRVEYKASRAIVTGSVIKRGVVPTYLANKGLENATKPFPN